MAKRKKSYNPFKMWGSYAGAVAFPIVAFLGLLRTLCGTDWIDGVCIGFSGIIFGIPLLIVSLPVGFLLGWGIHSIFRALKGRKRR